jgi:DNA repair photolyase
VLVAPVIPGLNDSEIPAVLAAVKEAGATAAGYVFLRLPLAVAPVFADWLGRAFPDRVEKVLGRIRAARGGRLNDSTFGARMVGTGELADQVRAMFRLFARRHGLDRDLPPYDCSRFRPPPDGRGQGRLF